MVKQTIAIFIFCILFPNTYPKSSHCLCRVSIAPYQNDLIFFLNRFLSTIIFVLTSSSSELTPNYYLIHSFIKQSIRPFIHSVFFLSITVILFSNPIVLYDTNVLKYPFAQAFLINRKIPFVFLCHLYKFFYWFLSWLALLYLGLTCTNNDTYLYILL